MHLSARCLVGGGELMGGIITNGYRVSITKSDNFFHKKPRV